MSKDRIHSAIMYVEHMALATISSHEIVESIFVNVTTKELCFEWSYNQKKNLLVLQQMMLLDVIMAILQ